MAYGTPVQDGTKAYIRARDAEYRYWETMKKNETAKQRNLITL